MAQFEGPEFTERLKRLVKEVKNAQQQGNLVEEAGNHVGNLWDTLGCLAGPALTNVKALRQVVEALVGQGAAEQRFERIQTLLEEAYTVASGIAFEAARHVGMEEQLEAHLHGSDAHPDAKVSHVTEPGVLLGVNTYTPVVTPQSRKA